MAATVSILENAGPRQDHPLVMPAVRGGAAAPAAKVRDAMIVADGMIVDFLVTTMSGSYNPSGDGDAILQPQRVAAFRLFLWADLAIAPTAMIQLLDTKKPEWRARLEGLVLVHMKEPQILIGQETRVSGRVSELTRYHSDPLDCSIAAEAEVLNADALVSFDKRMLKRFRGRTRVPVQSPLECWETLGVPRQSSPKWMPDQSNPLNGETWWRW